MYLQIRAMVTLLALMASLGLAIPEATAASEKLVFSISSGGTKTYEAVGTRMFRRTDGKMLRVDRFGNWLESSGETYSPHNGWLPSSEAISVGMEWRHDYRKVVKSQRRTRTCQVRAQKEVSVGAGSFLAWEIKCTNLKHGAKRPTNEIIWFSVGSESVKRLQLLRFYHSCAGGCRPYSSELVTWTMDGAAVASFE